MKIFISHHHELNNKHREYIQSLVEQLGYTDITPDEKTKVDDSLSDEQIRQKIRDEYLKDVDVTIVVVGSDTKNRKFIDWEIYSTIMDYQENGKTKPGGSIVVVNCCTDNNGEIKSWILDKELVMKYDGIKPIRSWNNTTKQSIRNEFNFLPDRLLHSMADNFDGENYKRIENNKPNEKVHNEYKHAVFPIIGYDRLKNDSNPKDILRLAIRQAYRYREVNKGKWNIDKLRRKDNEADDRELFNQIPA